MKKVIVQKEPVIPVVNIEKVDVERKFYLCVNSKTGDGIWALQYEEGKNGEMGGWIFRDVEQPEFGMYGHFNTPKKAIEESFRCGEVFEFDSLVEYSNYIVTYINKHS